MTEDTRDYEQEARDQGWKPISEFNGPDDKWTDPKTFVEKGEKITGILKSRVDRQQAEINELKNANKQFGEYQKTLVEKEREENTRLLSELEVARAAAINDQDGAEFTKIDRKMQQVRDDMANPPYAPPQGQLDPQASAWLANNGWYNENQTLRTYADGLVGQITSEGYQGQAYYNEITRRVQETFPQEFKNPNRSKSNSVETGSPADVESTGKRNYDSLPTEARAACDRFVANGLTTKEDYVKNFDWEG